MQNNHKEYRTSDAVNWFTALRHISEQRFSFRRAFHFQNAVSLGKITFHFQKMASCSEYRISISECRLRFRIIVVTYGPLYVDNGPCIYR